jgi:predicted NACHT family NTPase
VPEVGQTAVVAEALNKVANSLLKDIADAAKGGARKSLGKLQAEFGVGFSKYIERNRRRCGHVKTLLHRVDPISIEKAYVDPALRLKKKTIEGSKFSERLDQLKNVVVVGMGGSGKSIFIKHLFLSLCDDPFGKIPIFIELRDLNQKSDKDLFAHIYEQWSELIPAFTKEALESGFRAGKFYLLLDGLDEVDKKIRDDISKQIMACAYKYSSCPIVITSRPDDRFESWNEFFVAHMLPFDKRRVRELIDKIEIDGKIKRSFLKEVDQSLFETHREFLSNPLLCTMMLMTYNEFEEIPSKLHIFYARAFDVLFTRHDKTKTFFHRQFYTNLAEDDFKRLFSAFCFVSYIESTFSFERDKALDAIDAALQFDKPVAKAEDFLADLHESVSILVKDGDVYSFLHRSFQEYFVAVFLAERQLPQIGRVFKKIIQEIRGDNVARLLFEINRDAFESRYLMPVLRELRKDVEKVDFEREPAKALSLIYSSFMLHDGVVTAYSQTARSGVLSLISTFYQCGAVTKFANTARQEQWQVVADLTIDKDSSKRNGNLTLTIGSSVPDAAVKGSPFFENLLAMKGEIITLEKDLKRKLEGRSNLVSALLGNK